MYTVHMARFFTFVAWSPFKSTQILIHALVAHILVLYMDPIEFIAMVFLDCFKCLSQDVSVIKLRP